MAEAPIDAERLRLRIQRLLGARRTPGVAVWDAAWAERQAAFEESGDIADLAPNYYAPEELEKVIQLRDQLMAPAFEEADTIWELGCGSGYHLAQMVLEHKQHRFAGFDSSSAALNCIRAVNRELGTDIGMWEWNMRRPPYVLHTPTTAVLTIGALEQVGSDFRPFLDSMRQLQPTRVVNIEPLIELYDEHNLEDWLAAEYHRRRGYLQGYLTALRRLEEQGSVEILEVRKGFGNIDHIGHSHVVWRWAS